MCRARKRRSWQMLLPHMGETPAARCRKELQRGKLGLRSRHPAGAHPLEQAGSPVGVLFQSSINASTGSGWWTR
jgi:hypothetical protein